VHVVIQHRHQHLGRRLRAGHPDLRLLEHRYAAPQDKYAVVTALSGGGFSVTDQTATTYSFAQAAGTSWLISKISGKAETFTYSAGVLTTITSTTSGRALHVTWSTPAGAALDIYQRLGAADAERLAAGMTASPGSPASTVQVPS
jgi:hypothetical protein